MEDWREGSQNLKLLMHRFFRTQDFSASTDVTFQLPDGSEEKAHKIILGVSSEVFYTQFFGRWSDKTVKKVIVADDFESDTFRIMIQCIYNSGRVPHLEINEYLDLLKAANFYLLQEVIDECNEKLCEHVKSLEIQELIDWTHMVSQQSIHDKVYESCKEAILANLSNIIKEEKWDCIISKVQNDLLEDLEDTKVWKGDAYQNLQVLKRLCSLELDNLFPDRVIKFNSTLELYFESNDKYQEFILDKFSYNVSFRDPDDSSYVRFDDKLKDHLNSIETQDSLLSKMYSLIKKDGLDLDLEFDWDEDSYDIRDLEENGMNWDNQEEKHVDHYWLLLEFAILHKLENLSAHCYLRLYYIMLHSVPPTLAHFINRASETPGGEEPFKLGILVFVNSTVDWRWYSEPYVDKDIRLRSRHRRQIESAWGEAFNSFNEKAMCVICEQLNKSLADYLPAGVEMFREVIQIWCEIHSSSPEEASKKFEMMFGAVVGSVSNNSNGGT